MTEIYRDNQAYMSLNVAGASAVSAVIERGGSIVLSVTGESFSVPFSIYGYDGQFTVRWLFTVDGSLQTRSETHEIVTPYVSVAEIRDSLNLPADITDEKLVKTERVVRKIINKFVGSGFGKYYATKSVLGKGDEQLALPERLVSIDTVTGPYLNPTLNFYELRGDGRYIAATSVYPEGDWVFTNVIAAPDWDARHMWKENVRYSISGVWGWEDVPTEVTEAALILIEQQLCPDSEYRNRYIEDVNYADSRLSFNGRAYNGTGNVIADQLLSDFIRLPFTVI